MIRRIRRWIGIGRIPALLIVVFFPLSAAADSLTVHYHRPDADYDGWSLWSWNPDSNFKNEIPASGSDGYGDIFKLDLGAYGSASKIGLLPKFRNWDSKDDPDRYWVPGNGNEIYIVSADKTIYSSPPDLRPKVLKAYVDGLDDVRIVLSKNIFVASLSKDLVRVELNGVSYPAVSVAALQPSNGKTKTIEARLAQPLPAEGYIAGTAGYGDFFPSGLFPGKIIDSFFDGRPLGALYSAERTVFRVFAPTASAVELLLYREQAGGDSRSIAMTLGDNGHGAGHSGIWSAAVGEDLRNRYYTYRATTPEGTFEVIDPYSRSNFNHNGRGIVVFDTTPVYAAPEFDIADAVIYEMHIRDFTVDPDGGIRMRGKYLGLTETGTRLAGDSSVTTGIDHLKELGVNVIQIMPFQDYDNNEEKNDYNWGYMPFHFFSPEGSYATRRDDPTRVSEVKRMIDALHREGFKVVMDVVNNHTAEGNPEIRVSFNGLAPNYYYRLKDDGTYSNGSGCGNEFRSESPMGRKLIIDSLLYWVKEYGIDGFRFDLMGLIDLETLKQVVAAVRAAKPGALIYGEPWAGGSTTIRVTSKGDQKGNGFAVFNDNFRDALKGSAFSKDPGFVQAGRDVAKVKRGIMGSINDFTVDPIESINYVEAHDNHTLWDRLDVTTRGMTGREAGGSRPLGPAPSIAREDLVKMDKLAAVIVLTSQGIPFIHSGQEMLRTKNGSDNTYNAPDEVNMIHWQWAHDNRDVLSYYEGLIRLRQNHAMFRKATGEEVRRTLFFLDDDLKLPMTGGGIGYVLSRGPQTGQARLGSSGDSRDSWANALVLLNSNPVPIEFTVPVSTWHPVVNADHAGDVVVGPPVTSTSVQVAPRSAAIFYNDDAGFYETVLRPVLAARAARRQTFSVAAPGASRVTIAGSFNGWNADQQPLAKNAEGLWTTSIELEPGTYDYKFLQDGNWDALNPSNRTITVP